MTDPTPRRCTNCQGSLFPAWWDETQDSFHCQWCGTLTAGEPVAGPSRARGRGGLALGCGAAATVVVAVFLTPMLFGTMPDAPALTVILNAVLAGFFFGLIVFGVIYAVTRS